MMREAGESGALDAAIQRLDRALGQLEMRVASLSVQAEASNGGLFDQDRAKLAAELDASRGRERELESAGAAASHALGLAIAEFRAALSEPEAKSEIGASGELFGEDTPRKVVEQEA